MDSNSNATQAPATEAPAVDPAMTDAQSVSDMKDMKLVVMDSAELATRAASLAANAGLDLRNATKELLRGNEEMVQGSRKQGKFSMILIGAAGGVMLITAALFVFMSLRLQGRVAQLDEMVLAVGKRVVEMDASLELVGGAQEMLKTVATKQGELLAAHTRLDARMEEVVKTSQGLPEQTAKQVETRLAALTKQVAALEGRLQGQSAATNRIAGQIQSMQGAVGDTAAVKRELEALARQQRERQSGDSSRAAQEAAAARARDSMVQYPRKQPDKP
jgi:uncharacterized protein YoxC